MTPLGCARCAGEDPEAAWLAMRAHRERSFVQESHFGVHVCACACGQRFVEVFLERIDWKDGNDDQDWLVLPITAEEHARLCACGEDLLERTLAEIGAGRRFLARSYGQDGALRALWRAGGFAIGPHD